MFVLQAPSDADLKEHMVGIIFSRSKLTNLQKQVRRGERVCLVPDSLMEPWSENMLGPPR